MRRISILMIMILFLVLLLTGCGYNNILYKHLSNKENYSYYETSIKEFYYFNRNNYQVINSLDQNDFEFETIYFSVSEIDGFHGDKCLVDGGKLSDSMLLLSINYDNYKVLLDNGFFNDYVLNYIIGIDLSNTRYMDAHYYYIASVSYNGKEYLTIEEGLNNIIKMMDDNRGII